MLVLNAFPAISEGLDPPSWLTLMHSKWAPPIANLLHNSFSDKQSSLLPRDLPLQTLWSVSLLDRTSPYKSLATGLLLILNIILHITHLAVSKDPFFGTLDLTQIGCNLEP